jgi:hypothetical protein
VTTEVTGHEEYIEHGVNALVCDWDDPRGTARQLDLLARDRVLLHQLRLGALDTARTWPRWEQAGQFMAGALRAIRHDPPPETPLALARLMADVRVGIEDHREVVAERDELAWKVYRFQRLQQLPVIRHALGLRYRRSGRMLLLLARPLTRRAKQKLLNR